jgi:hypothetical protein
MNGPKTNTLVLLSPGKAEIAMKAAATEMTKFFMIRHKQAMLTAI